MSEPARQMPSSSPHGQVSPGEWQARVDLAAAHRFAALKGWQDDHMVYNHFSARVPGEPDHFLMKPHSVLFREVTASNLVKIPLEGRELGFNDDINPAGYAIHGGILDARKDVNAVLHLHSIPGAAVGVLERGLMFVTQEGMQFYNRIGYHAFEGIAEIDERESIVRDLQGYNALVLRNHGLLTCGRNVGEAVKRLFHLIRMAEVQLAVLATGESVVQPSDEVCERTARMFEGRPLSAHEGDWAALLRWLDYQGAAYAG